MVHDGTRATIYDPLTDTTLDMGVVEEEDVTFDAAITRQAIPLTSAQAAIMESLFGRSRIIGLEGIKVGTQDEIETFIEQFTSRIDVAGLMRVLRYYPYFHPDNTSAASNEQDQYYEVLINNFSYRTSVDRRGVILVYDLELFQGNKLIG